MGLSTDDLLKIEKLLQILLGKRIDKLEENQIKMMKSLGDLQDSVSEIRHELDTEHEFRYKRLEEIDGRVKMNTKEIGNIKEVLSLQ